MQSSFFGQSKPFDFLPFSLTSPSSLLKLPNLCHKTPAKRQVSVLIVSKNGCFAEVLLRSSKHLRKNYKYLKMFHFEGSQKRISCLHTMLNNIHIHIRGIRFNGLFIAESALSLSSQFTDTPLKYLETNNSNTT